MTGVLKREILMLTMPALKVAVEPIFDDDKIGSIIVPEQAKGRCDQGLVKYIGSEVKMLEVGDHVLFSGYTGTLLELEDEGLLIIMPEDFIVAVVHDDPIEIPDLYFKDREGKFFNATHEMALHIIANRMRGHTSMRTSRNQIAYTPTHSDYDKLR